MDGRFVGNSSHEQSLEEIDRKTFQTPDKSLVSVQTRQRAAH